MYNIKNTLARDDLTLFLVQAYVVHGLFLFIFLVKTSKMHLLLKFSLFCWFMSYTICESRAEPGGYQGGNQWGNANQWQGISRKHSFREDHGQRPNFGGPHQFVPNQWQGYNDGFGSNRRSKGNFGDRGTGRSYSPNSYNTAEGYGYDYTIPGANVHFAANRGTSANSFGRQAEWPSQNGAYEKNGWSQKHDFGEVRSQKDFSGSKQWPQKNVGGQKQWLPQNSGSGW